MVMVVERWDAKSALGIFQMLVSYSEFHYIVMCVT